MGHRAWTCISPTLLLSMGLLFTMTPQVSAFAQTPLPLSGTAPRGNSVPILSQTDQTALQRAIMGSSRIEPARDRWRNPSATLQFFGVRSGDTVIEIWPGQGWYTSILGPYLKQGSGRLIIGHFDATSTNSTIVRQIVDAYQARFTSNPATYGAVNVVPFGPRSSALGPPGTVDSVLTFRNIHNWMAQGWAEKAFGDFYQVLKPGGILGIEEHRGRIDEPQDPLAGDGYVREDFVIQMAREAGFEFIGRSEINANPADNRDHPFGVWTLPPVSRTSPLGQRDDPGFDRTRFTAIGESDRMTLRFRKPITSISAPPLPGGRWSSVVIAPSASAARSAPPPTSPTRPFSGPLSNALSRATSRPVPVIAPPVIAPPVVARPVIASPVILPPITAASTSPLPIVPKPAELRTNTLEPPANSQATAPQIDQRVTPVELTQPIITPPTEIAPAPDAKSAEPPVPAPPLEVDTTPKPEIEIVTVDAAVPAAIPVLPSAANAPNNTISTQRARPATRRSRARPAVAKTQPVLRPAPAAKTVKQSEPISRAAPVRPARPVRSSRQTEAPAARVPAAKAPAAKAPAVIATPRQQRAPTPKSAPKATARAPVTARNAVQARTKKAVPPVAPPVATRPSTRPSSTPKAAPPPKKKKTSPATPVNSNKPDWVVPRARN